MSWNDYPALGERCYLETLPNGLRLRVVPKPGFAGKFAFLGVNVGSCDTQLPLSGGWQTVPDGTAHFLEHRMFCLPDCDPEAAFSSLGAESNAFTDYAMTGYYFTCTEHFEDCLRLLLRMASTPYFPPEAMAAERAVIADEIALYDDSPEDCAQERLCRALYRCHPIHIPIAGSRRSIRAVTPELLRRCFDAFYPIWRLSSWAMWTRRLPHGLHRSVCRRTSRRRLRGLAAKRNLRAHSGTERAGNSRSASRCFLLAFGQSRPQSRSGRNSRDSLPPNCCWAKVQRYMKAFIHAA